LGHGLAQREEEEGGYPRSIGSRPTVDVRQVLTRERDKSLEFCRTLYNRNGNSVILTCQNIPLLHG